MREGEKTDAFQYFYLDLLQPPFCNVRLQPAIQYLAHARFESLQRELARAQKLTNTRSREGYL